ncbi:MAG: hypothetical protein HS116_05975 [Planctomycetes bacterium]|nr:hypothetical protein [Planctomycetota bacterium]
MSRISLTATLFVLSAAVSGGEDRLRHGDYLPAMGDQRLYFMELGELYRLYGDRAWEIVPGFSHNRGHLGTRKVGDTLDLTVSVGPIGLRSYARSKNFGRGDSPMPVLEVLRDGKPGGEVVERIRFDAGAC